MAARSKDRSGPPGLILESPAEMSVRRDSFSIERVSLKSCPPFAFQPCKKCLSHCECLDELRHTRMNLDVNSQMAQQAMLDKMLPDEMGIEPADECEAPGPPSVGEEMSEGLVYIFRLGDKLEHLPRLLPVPGVVHVPSGQLSFLRIESDLAQGSELFLLLRHSQQPAQ